MMGMKLENDNSIFILVSCYVPQVECEGKRRSELDEVMWRIPRIARVVIDADFIVGAGNRGDKEVMSRFGIQNGNAERQSGRLCKKDGNCSRTCFIPEEVEA